MQHSKLLVYCCGAKVVRWKLFVVTSLNLDILVRDLADRMWWI